jgi:non-ribosomal peptide synthetase component F
MGGTMHSQETVIDIFHDRVASTPDAIALVASDETLTYRELARRSDIIASFLLRKNIGPGHMIPIDATRSTSFIVGIIGILKAGAAYIPIDHHYPRQRKQFMREQSGASLALGTLEDGEPTDLATQDDFFSIPSLLRHEFDRHAVPRPASSGEDPIYVIFTSGTTGVPKGVIVEHHSVYKLVRWHNETFDVTRLPDRC